MTMQVGMLGTDGVVLASDTVWSMSRQAGVRDRSGSYKIKISENRKIAASCAIDMYQADRIASRIISELDSVDAAAREQRIREIARAIPPNREVECLVAFVEPQPSLFFVQRSRHEDEPICRMILDKSFVGDVLNPAVFWVERYYQRLPIETLKGLAAHAIVEAGNLNSGIIGGLEMVCGNTEGFRRLPTEEIDSFAEQSRRWYTQIGKMVIGSD